MAEDPDITERTSAWVRAGIIDQSQASRIIEHERAAGIETERHSHVVAIFSVLGGLLVGLGIVLTVAANWNELSDLTKLVTLIASMVGAYAAGIVADARQAPWWAGTTAYVVGIMTFAAGVFLVGQIYNVRAHDPLGFLIIAIVGTIIALLVNRMAVGFVAAVAWLGWGVHELIVSIAYQMDTQVVISMVGSMTLLGIAALGASWALEGLARRVGEDGSRGLTSLVANGDVIATPLRIVSLLGLLGVLNAASFAWHLEEDLDVRTLTWQVGSTFALALVAAALVWGLARLRLRAPAAVSLAVAAGCVVLAVVVQDDLLASILADVLLAAGGAGLVLLGLAEQRRDSFIIGIMWIGVLIIARYLDFLSSVEWGGLGFVGAGVLLIVIAWLGSRSRDLWRRRRGKVAA